MKLKPISAMLIVAAFVAAVLLADYALEGGFGRADYERVSPNRSGEVEVDLAGLAKGELRHYRFLNAGNQEVKFFVARAEDGEIHVAIDACEACFKLKRGFRREGEWVVCNKCEKAFRVSEVNQGGGGCKPIPLAHSVNGDQLVLAESDILTGWRYFR